MITWSMGSTQLAPGTMSAARPHSGPCPTMNTALRPHRIALAQEVPQLGSPGGPAWRGNPAHRLWEGLAGPGSCCPAQGMLQGASGQPLGTASHWCWGPWALTSHVIQAAVTWPGALFWGENRVSVQVSARRLREGLGAAQVHRNRPRLCGGAWQGGEQSSSVYYCTYIYISCVYTDSFLSWKY